MNKFVVIGLSLLPISLGCTFPSHWKGEYFHLEYSSSPLVVTDTSITEKGGCVWSKGSQYVLKGEDSGKSCWRCLSIHRKHQNVLQYKESDCEYENQFSSYGDLCQNIPGDGHMHSMFRRNASATPCPLQGPHMFTYAKGGTGPSCVYPKSYLDTCDTNKMMKLHYQACYDVKGTQSVTNSWKCIASWTEGSKGYFVGELVEDHQVKDQDRFRCFVHDKDYDSSGVLRMGVSGVATCNGLPSPLHGDKVFTLERVLGSGLKCRYPGWLAKHHSWQGISGRQQIHINSGDKSLKIQSDSADLKSVSEEHLSCQNILPEKVAAPPGAVNQHNPHHETIYVNSPSDTHYQTKSRRLATMGTANLAFQDNNKQPDGGHNQANTINLHPGSLVPEPVVKIVQHVKSGCESGYVCTQMTRLTDNLMSLETGAVSRDPKETCESYYFSNPKKSMYIARSRQPLACPLNGRYTFLVGDNIPPNKHSSVLESACPGARKVQLSSGCGATHLNFKCDQSVQAKNVTELKFECHAHWTGQEGGGGVSHLILSLADHIGFYCLTYTDYGMSLVEGDCQEDRPVQYRFSSTGPCIQALSATRSSATHHTQGSTTTVLLISSSLLFLIFNQ